jgi:thioredoxin-related protein
MPFVSTGAFMKARSWLLLLGALSAFAAAAETPKLDILKKEGELGAGMTNPGSHEYPDWFKNSFLDLRDDIKDAAGANKRVMLFFYQDGCPYCKKLLEVNLAQKNITDKMKKDIDAITINMWGDREVTDVNGEHLIEKKFAAKHKVMYTPTILFFDEQGKVVLRINGYYEPHKFLAALNYVSGKHEKEGGFRDYFAKLNPQPAAGKLHEQTFLAKPPHDLTRVKKSGAKPAMVLFEQKDCPACDELHGDIMKRKETLDQIKRLDVVQVDMWSKTPLTKPDGKTTTAVEWAKELDVKYAPSMVFFDASGQEVFRIEAYLKSFHIQSVMDYVASAAYKDEKEFQRYIEARAEHLREKGVTINLMD